MAKQLKSLFEIAGWVGFLSKGAFFPTTELPTLRLLPESTYQDETRYVKSRKLDVGSISSLHSSFVGGVSLKIISSILEVDSQTIYCP